MDFTEKMKTHLSKTGWFANRKIKTFDNYMKKYNYPIFIREFIREYGELLITDFTEDKSNVTNKTNLNPLKTDGMEFDSVAAEYAKDLDKKLFVLGLYSPENYDIAADENGAVYFLGENCLCVGKNLYEGIESIIRIDQWSSIELNPNDTASKEWRNIEGDLVNFNNYEFKYKTF